jgi:hypothetical protein
LHELCNNVLLTIGLSNMQISIPFYFFNFPGILFMDKYSRRRQLLSTFLITHNYHGIQVWNEGLPCCDVHKSTWVRQGEQLLTEKHCPQRVITAKTLLFRNLKIIWLLYWICRLFDYLTSSLNLQIIWLFDFFTESADYLIIWLLRWICGLFDYLTSSLDLQIIWLFDFFTGSADYLTSSLDLQIIWLLHWICRLSYLTSSLNLRIIWLFDFFAIIHVVGQDKWLVLFR